MAILAVGVAVLLLLALAVVAGVILRPDDGEQPRVIAFGVGASAAVHGEPRRGGGVPPHFTLLQPP